jgi:hypothetical protein
LGGGSATPAPAEAPAEETPTDDTDLDFGGDTATDDTATADDTTKDTGSSDKPFDDEPFDAGVEADEESDPKKFIEQLTGKLGQSLRKYNEDQGQPDFELEKFAVNSLLSATHTGEMPPEDQKDIIKKIKSSGKGDGDEEPSDDDTSDTEETPEDNGEETGSEEVEVTGDDSENMFENDILDEMSLDDHLAKQLIELYDSSDKKTQAIICKMVCGNDNVVKKRTIELSKGDILHNGTEVVSKPFVGGSTPSGKVNVNVLYPNKSDYVTATWGKSTTINVIEPNRERFLKDLHEDIDKENIDYIFKKLRAMGIVSKPEKDFSYMRESNLFLKYPKKNNMFQEGSNDILDEYEIYEVVEEGKKKKKKTKKDACYHKVRARYDVWPSAYACVPENTSKALTRYGWKHVDELNVGDEIMTYNIEKDELEFKPILNLHRYKDVKTNVVRSGNNGFIFEATDNHKWVVKLPDIKGNRLQKYNRINDKALIETSDLLTNKSNKSLVVSAPYNGGNNVKLDEIFKYGTNWVKYILDITNEQRQAWLFSAIVYDGNQQKVERLTENINNIDDLNWSYTGSHGKQSFGFKQKDIEHRDAFLLSAFLNSGLVTWKKAKDKDIYSCHYSSNKPLKNTSNFKLVKENISDVWCPETENGTWVMMQETEGRGIITITGNSGALVKCRKAGAANWGNSADESVDMEALKEKWSAKYKKSIDCNNPKGFSQKAHCQGRKK